MPKSRPKPIVFVEILNILGFLLLFIHSNFNINIVYAGVAVCTINYVVYSAISRFELGDSYLFIMVAMLISIGMLMMFRLDINRGFLQMQWFLIGIFLMFTVYFMYRTFRNWNNLLGIYIILCIALFLVTIIFGNTVNGSRNWITIAGKSVQPSEITKIIYVFALAAFLSGEQTDEKRHKVSKKDLALMCFVYMCIGFLIIQREWGTAVLFLLVYFTMLFLYNTPKKLLIINIAITVFVLICGYKITEHISSRVNVWLDPWSDATGKGYQITQSLIAITSGGFFGSGLGDGNPYFIPEVHSDFIFSAICEEMGLFMGLAIIMLYFIFTYRGFKVAMTARSKFDRALSLGLVSCFGFQTFIIVGGVIKFIPLTGITLPFVSYGGSSMISCFMILGLLTAISHKNT